MILYQLWRFVTPGLRANEKRYAIPFVVATVGLFLTGAFVAWFTFPHALGFLHAVGGPGIQTVFTAQKYLTLILALMAIFGLTFEFPVVLVALELAGVADPATPQPLAAGRDHRSSSSSRRSSRRAPTRSRCWRWRCPMIVFYEVLDPHRQAPATPSVTRDASPV